MLGSVPFRLFLLSTCTPASAQRQTLACMCSLPCVCVTYQVVEVGQAAEPGTENAAATNLVSCLLGCPEVSGCCSPTQHLDWKALFVRSRCRKRVALAKLAGSVPPKSLTAESPAVSERNVAAAGTPEPCHRILPQSSAAAPR